MEPAIDDWPAKCHASNFDRANSAWMDCYQQRWGSVEAVLKLPELDRLSCEVCRVGDLTGLAKHPVLDDLFLSNTVLERPETLGRLVNLKKLLLQEVSIISLRHLLPLTKLQELDINSRYLRDISALGKLMNLRALSLRASCIKDASVVKGLTNLRVLKITTFDFDSWAFLEKMTQLRRLAIGGPTVRDVGFVAKLEHLAELTLSFHCVPLKQIAALKRARPSLQIYDNRSKKCPK